MIVVEVDGAWNNEGLGSAVRATLENGLLEIAEELKVVSQAEVPVDTGALQESAFVEKVANWEGNLVFVVGYAKKYAVEQHETLFYHHDQGKAKYLEDPFNAMQADVLGRLASEVTATLSR
jgi:hypothetical protein